MSATTFASGATGLKRVVGPLAAKGRAGSLILFATITDDPPPEVAATGHNRYIIPRKPQNLSIWFTPGVELADHYALSDNRERPYYAHELAA